MVFINQAKLSKLKDAALPDRVHPDISDYRAFRGQVRQQELPESVLAHRLEALDQDALETAWRELFPRNVGVRFVNAHTPNRYLQYFLPNSTWDDPRRLVERLRPGRLIVEAVVDPNLVGDNLIVGLGLLDPRVPRTLQKEWLEQKGRPAVIKGLRLAMLAARPLTDGDDGTLVVAPPNSVMKALLPDAREVLENALGSIIIYRSHETRINGVTSITQRPMFFDSCRSAYRSTLHKQNSYGSEVGVMLALTDDVIELVDVMDLQWKKGVSDAVKRTLKENLKELVASAVEILGGCVNPLKVEAKEALTEALHYFAGDRPDNPSAVMAKLCKARRRLCDRVVDVGDKQGHGSGDGMVFQQHAALAEAWLDEVRRQVATIGPEALAELRVTEEDGRFLGLRPFRAYAVALIRIGKQIQNRAELNGYDDLEVRNLTNKAWTVLKLDTIHRGVDELLRRLTYRPPMSPTLLSSALAGARAVSEIDLPNAEIGMLPSTAAHRSIFRGFYDVECLVSAESESCRRTRGWTAKDSLVTGSRVKGLIEERLPSSLFELAATALGRKPSTSYQWVTGRGRRTHG